MEIIYSMNLENRYFSNKNFTGFIGEVNDLNLLLPTTKEVTLKLRRKVKRIVRISSEDMKLLGLSKEIKNKKIKELSYSELKIIKLLKAVSLKPALIILNNTDIGMNYKLKSKISKYIKTIHATQNINFIIISNDLNFLNKTVKHIIISKNGIIKYQGDIISGIKQELIEKPTIINFIDMANKKGAKLDYTLDNKELLKNIYRSVF